MEINKANDMMVAVLDNPTATTYDLLSSDINGGNTSLFTKDEYKSSKFIQDKFKDSTGKFDDLAFNDAYSLASNKFAEMTDDQYLKGLDQIQYSPFDITRPKDAKTYKVDVEYSKDINPFKSLKGWTSVGSVDEGELTAREIAQQGKIFDPKTGEWSKDSVNDRGLLNNFLGETLVYGQWDEDGVHDDLEYGVKVKHKKGD